MYKTKLIQDYDENQKYITKKFNNGDFDYWLFITIISFEYATGTKYNGYSYAVEITCVAPDECKKYHRNALEFCGYKNDYTKVEIAEILSDYGISALLYQEFGNNRKKLLKQAHEELCKINMLFGFYMDKQINAFGNNGWDFIKGEIGF